MKFLLPMPLIRSIDMRFEGKTVLAIHDGQTDTAMVRGPQVAKLAALRLAVRC